MSKLQPDTQLLILDMDSETSASQSSANWKSHSELRPAPVIWGRKNNAPICLKCIVEQFIQKLEHLGASDEQTSSELIIVTTGRIVDQGNDVIWMAERLTETSVSLRVVIFPYISESEENDLSAIRELVSKVSGSIDLVARDENAAAYRVGSQLGLGNVLDSIENDNQAFKHVLLSRKTFYDKAEIRFDFHVDSTLLRNTEGVKLVAQFVSSSQLTPNEDYKLLSPDLRTVYTTKSSFYQYQFGLFEVPLDKTSAPSGKWTLYYNNQNDRNDSLVGQAYAIVPQRAKPISAKCWLNRDRIAASSNVDDGPPVLYVSLTQDYNKLVQSAVVDVTLTDGLGRPLPGTPIRMFDDGLGSPDITSGDGIYSQLLLDAEQTGFYGLRVHIRSHDGNTRLHNGLTTSDSRYKPSESCCGQSMAESTQAHTQVDNLQREVDCGFFYVDRHSSKDEYVGRINNVRVKQVDTAGRTVTVAWSVPAGTPSGAFEIKVFRSKDRRVILDKGGFERLTGAGELSLPSQNTVNDRKPKLHYGDLREATLNVSSPYEDTYSVAIKASSRGDKPSYTVSNVVTFYMSSDPSLVTTEGKRKHFPASAYDPFDPSYADPDATEYSTDSRSGSIAGLQTWHIIAIVAASLIVFVICMACLICMCGSKRRKDCKDTEAHYGTSSQKHVLDSGKGLSNLNIQTTMGMGTSHTNLVSEKNGSIHGIGNISTVSDRNLTSAGMGNAPEVSQTMSPVQSWPADVLLGHYGRVQQARERKEPVPVMRVEDIPASGTGSCTSSDPSRESGSYDDNTFPAANQQDWRYENLASVQNGTAYQGHIGNMYGGGEHQQQQQYYDQQQMSQDGALSWRDSYAPRIETPDYDARYNAVPRRIGNAVSQV